MIPLHRTKRSRALSFLPARALAGYQPIDLKGSNIRVNVVSPSTVVTPAYKSELGLNEAQIEAFAAQAAATTPLGRTGTPDEIAKALLFLASPDSSAWAATASLFDIWL